MSLSLSGFEHSTRQGDHDGHHQLERIGALSGGARDLNPKAHVNPASLRP